MRRRTAAGLLVIASAGLLLSQFRLLPQDQGVLLEINGRPVDAAGRLLGLWQRLARQCGAVQALAPGSARWLEAQRVLAGYSPPASLLARPVQVLAWGPGRAGGRADGRADGQAGNQGVMAGDADSEWLLAEAVWPAVSASPGGAALAPLDPSIVPLARRGGVLHVQASGIWSGDAGPWAAPVFIRRFLAERLPGLPAPLRQCLDPQLAPFAAP